MKKIFLIKNGVKNKHTNNKSNSKTHSAKKKEENMGKKNQKPNLMHIFKSQVVCRC